MPYLRFVQVLQVIAEQRHEEYLNDLRKQAHLGFQIVKSNGAKIDTFKKYLDMMGLGPEDKKLKNLTPEETKKRLETTMEKVNRIKAAHLKGKKQ